MIGKITKLGFVLVCLSTVVALIVIPMIYITGNFLLMGIIFFEYCGIALSVLCLGIILDAMK